jgi:hypothetical protein
MLLFPEAFKADVTDILNSLGGKCFSQECDVRSTPLTPANRAGRSSVQQLESIRDERQRLAAQ